MIPHFLTRYSTFNTPLIRPLRMLRPSVNSMKPMSKHHLQNTCHSSTTQYSTVRTPHMQPLLALHSSLKSIDKSAASFTSQPKNNQVQVQACAVPQHTCKISCKTPTIPRSLFKGQYSLIQTLLTLQSSLKSMVKGTAKHCTCHSLAERQPSPSPRMRRSTAQLQHHLPNI